MPPKKRNWIKYVFYAVISFILLLIITGLFTDFGATAPNANENDAIPLANESVEVMGPLVESARDYYKEEAEFNNNKDFYATESGDALGYTGDSRSYYYVENGQVYGPFILEREDRFKDGFVFLEFMEAKGWKAGMQETRRIKIMSSKSKSWITLSEHTLESVRTGPIKDCFDIQVPSQNSLIYDGEQVGLHTILDGKCSSPVTTILLSNDGLHYAYLVRAQHGYFVVVDGKKSNIYPMISDLHFEGDIFVFNAIASDFMNFVRVKIATN